MKRMGKGLLLLLLPILAILFKNGYESRRQFLEGKEFLANGKTEEAIFSFDRSVHSYFPGNPYVKFSLDELWAVGQKAEKENPKMALLAYDSGRGGIYAIRSFYSPYKDWLPRINERIAQLRSNEEIQNQPELSYENVHAFHQSALDKDVRPKTLWGMVVIFAFLGWMISTFGWIWKGFNKEGVMSFKTSLPWVISIVLFFSGWILGITKA